jgi:FkbM family methyltransferase
MKQLLKAALAQVGYRVQGTKYIPKQLLEPDNLRPLELADVIRRRMFDVARPLTFVQIGAFDGITKDPLFEYIDRHGWRGVMVEPQPDAVKKLRELYGASEGRIVILQAAIDREPGRRALYIVKPASANVPRWASGMASFDRTHLTRHAYLVPGLESMIREISVECITFDRVLAALPTPDIDLLQIDAEGADAMILSLFPFARAKPAIIHFEIKNLVKQQKEECLQNLLNLGYRLAPSGTEDMMALLA